MIAMSDAEASSFLDISTWQGHAPFQLGRLFALLERLQRLAYPKDAPTMHDRFWALSTVNPASGFKLPLQMVPVYLGRLPRAQQSSFKRLFYDLSCDLPICNLPKTMSSAEQSLFSLGYCFQRTSLVRDQIDGVNA
jgi:CRISPR-associated protein Csd1